MKLYALLFLLLTLHSAQLFGQEKLSPQEVFDQIVAHAEEASMYREKVVDWPLQKELMRGMVAKATTVEELRPGLIYLLGALGDGHGRIIHNGQILAHYSSPDTKPHLANLDGEIFRDVQMGQVYPFRATLLEDRVGYVRIVGLPMGDNEQMTRDIQEEVCRLVEAGAKEWVIDLRYNGGGNMFPMAEGIAALLGDGPVGGAAGLTPEENAVWRYEDADFYYDDYTVGLEEKCRAKGQPKIAVLTSLYTASSGEAIAVILKDRPDTRFFGEKTQGLVTVTDWHVIDETTAMTISVSYYQDRNGTIYNQYVPVDVECPFVPTPLSDDDQCLQQALQWLQSK